MNMLMMALPVKCWNIAAVLMQKLGSFSFCHEIKCFFQTLTLSEFELDIETVDEHKTRHTYLTINIWMSTFSTFSSLSFSSRLTAMLSLIKRGGNAWSCFFDLSHDLFVLIYIHHLQAASLLAKSSQEPNCSREAWPAETGKKETKHQRSLRGLIEFAH